jgi:hypothetical protein
MVTDGRANLVDFAGFDKGERAWHARLDLTAGHEQAAKLLAVGSAEPVAPMRYEHGKRHVLGHISMSNISAS